LHKQAKLQDITDDRCKEEIMEDLEVIPVTFEDGTEIHVLATMLGGEEPVSAKADLLSFDHVTGPIKKVAREIAKVIRDVQPNKATVTLGFEIATSEGQLTALLVKGTATANLAVTLEWVKEKETQKTGKSRSTSKR
jgi:hypothetical protein